MFDTYNVPSKIDVEHSGDVLLRDQKHEWREIHCPNCKDGIITEKYFDEGMAVEYLESIGELSCPVGVPMQAHIHSASYYAAKRGDNVNFIKEKTYKCVHHYCNKIEKI